MSCMCMTCEAFFCVCSLTNAHGVDVCMYVCMYVCVCVPGATATTINAVCHKCGIISKSAKISCCGRGGSWFRNCGSVGNAKLDHTWHEGIRVCKARARATKPSGQQPNAAQQLNSSHVYGTRNSKAVITAATKRTFTPVNISARMVSPNLILTSAKTAAAHTRTLTTTLLMLLPLVPLLS